MDGRKEEKVIEILNIDGQAGEIFNRYRIRCYSTCNGCRDALSHLYLVETHRESCSSLSTVSSAATDHSAQMSLDEAMRFLSHWEAIHPLPH